MVDITTPSSSAVLDDGVVRLYMDCISDINEVYMASHVERKNSVHEAGKIAYNNTEMKLTT